jgi:hypothetical protein
MKAIATEAEANGLPPSDMLSLLQCALLKSGLDDTARSTIIKCLLPNHVRPDSSLHPVSHREALAALPSHPLNPPPPTIYYIH